MSRLSTFAIFLLAVFLQAGAYGLTFLLPRLFERFGADEKAVGVTLTVATVSTLITVYYSGHLSDWFGRVMTLALACVLIAVAMVLFAMTESMGPVPILASLLMGAGWGLTYALAPVVLTRLVTAEERVRYFAMNSVVLMAGFGLSPVMASEIEKAGGTVVDAFMVVAALALVSAFLFFILIRPVRAHAINPGPEASFAFELLRDRRDPQLACASPVHHQWSASGASIFSTMNNFQTVFAECPRASIMRRSS